MSAREHRAKRISGLIRLATKPTVKRNWGPQGQKPAPHEKVDMVTTATFYWYKNKEDQNMVGWIIKIGLIIAFCSIFPERLQTGMFFLIIAAWIFVKVKEFLDAE